MTMQRRGFLKNLGLVIVQFLVWRKSILAVETAPPIVGRVRPSGAGWPSADRWQELRDAVRGNLIKVRSLFSECESDPKSASCREAIDNSRNPYYIGDQPGGTQISGWLDAWTPAPSVYAVVAEDVSDVAAGVNFARENNLRLVVKGGAHSYQGTSSAPDSLLIWARKMNNIVMHDSFRPRGSEEPPRSAVTVETGAVWMDVYDVVTTKSGRYVQGGGCATVGVAGLIQSGGFGSFSKQFGLACASLLEAEVVTADGTVRTANAVTNPDLFWALKGGGGGTFGVVTKMTLQTYDLPETFGDVSVSIKANSDAAFRKLINNFLRFYSENLFNSHWGESVKARPSNTLSVDMVFCGLDRQTAEGIWRQFLDNVQADRDLTITKPFVFEIMPGRNWWDIDYLQKYSVGSVTSDKRAGAARTHVWWTGDAEEVGAFMHAYQSAWLPAKLLKNDVRESLVDALFASSRHWTVALHFNKGLAGAPPEVVAAARQTAVNPAVADAFALAIIAGSGPPAYLGLPKSSADISSARHAMTEVSRATARLLELAPKAGSYVAEGDYFDKEWQNSFWGGNYPRLRALKDQLDPDGLFFVHHGVGSEDWSADGFTRIKHRRA